MGRKLRKAIIVDGIITLMGIILLTVILSYLDSFEWLYHFSRQHEILELDEIIIALIVSPVFAFWFAIRRWQEAYKEFVGRRLAERENEITKLIVGHDILTGLPNRLLFADRLTHTMAQCKRNGQRVLIVYLDLDGFKDINDQFGHDVGDRYLVAIATRIKNALREGDTVARLGGDEFAALLNVDEGQHTNTSPLDRMLSAANRLVELDGFKCQASASMGVTVYPQEKDISADQLLRQADQAMYQAKLSGKNQYRYFDSDSDLAVRNREESIHNIEEGFRAGQFEMYYQPKVNMRSGQILGMEALIRWRHPEKGVLEPARFLPVIEKHPFSFDLGMWVIDEVLGQMTAWGRDGIAVAVSVNVSAIQLQSKDFITQLKALLQKHPDVDPHNLSLEIVESSALDDIYHAGQLVAECSRLGVRFSIDDFGAGYSPLAYLKSLPVNEVKLDQAFVRDLLSDKNDQPIVEAVMALAEVFKMDFIAEGVESKELGDRLLELGCEHAQGYAIARPMPASEVIRWMQNWTEQPLWSGEQGQAEKVREIKKPAGSGRLR